MKREFFKAAIVAFCAVFFTSAQAYSISIDEFATDQLLSTATSASQASFSVDAYRSTRKFITTVLVPNGGDVITTRAGTNSLRHSQDTGVSGRSRIIWDGNSTISTGAVPNAAAAVDFFQDGGNKFVLDLQDIDFGFATLAIKVYDSVDPSGMTYSTAFKVVGASSIGSVEFSYDPSSSDFLDAGPNGHADFARVGAIELIIDATQYPALDVKVGALKTNGICDLYPDSNGRVIDECGVCAGDNSTCLDCAGIPNGNTQFDQCGVCGGDGKSCVVCEGIDIFETQAQLDGLAKQQEFMVRAVLKLLQSIGRKSGKSFDSYINKTKAKAHELQISNWVLSWTLPSLINQCTNASVCVFTSNESILETYRAQAVALNKLAQKAAKKTLANGGPSYSIKIAGYKKGADDVFNEAIALSNTVPALNYSCD